MKKVLKLSSLLLVLVACFTLASCSKISEGYAKNGSIPVRLDMENIAPTGVSVVSQKLIEENRKGLVRHSSNRVARAVYYWYKKTLKK